LKSTSSNTGSILPPSLFRLARAGYSIPRNLLLRFSTDTIDDTPVLASILQSSAVASILELTVKTLPGDHVRPMQQDLNRTLSPDLMNLANQAVAQGTSLWSQLGALAEQASLPQQTKEQLTGLAKVAEGKLSI
jgi:hypothetical protein